MMRVFPTVTLCAATLLTGSPLMACLPASSAAPACTQQLTVVGDGEGFTIRPREKRPVAMSARLTLPPHRLGTSTWLDNAMLVVKLAFLPSCSLGRNQ